MSIYALFPAAGVFRVEASKCALAVRNCEYLSRSTQRFSTRLGAISPSWAVIATQDRSIHPTLLRRMARRVGATTQDVDGSHLVFRSKPREVADLIDRAARRGNRPGRTAQIPELTRGRRSTIRRGSAGSVSCASPVWSDYVAVQASPHGGTLRPGVSAQGCSSGPAAGCSHASQTRENRSAAGRAASGQERALLSTPGGWRL